MLDLSSSCSSCSTNVNMSLFEHNFSIEHHNVQSLLSKVDQLQMELSHFDVIALNETWLSQDIQKDERMFQKLPKTISKRYKCRPDDTCDGVLVYVKTISLVSVEHT